MSTKDASKLATGGETVYQPGSPFRSARITVDLGEYALAASGADTLNTIPLAAGEFVHAAYLRVDVVTDAGVTLRADDSRTGGGAVVAATAGDALATTLGAGAGVGKVGSDAGYLTVKTVAIVATTKGKVTLYAIIGSAF